MVQITVNASGIMFQFGSKCLENYPTHTLTKMYKSAVDSGRPLSFNVDRPADSFAAILAFYQTEELHIPNNLCPRAFKRELDYWNIPVVTLDSCCLYRYYEFMDQLETRQKLKSHRLHQENANTYPPCPDIHTRTRWQRIRQRTWNIIDHKDKSLQANVYLCVVFAMVLVSILVLALSTLSSLQRSPTPCEMLEYLDHSQHEVHDQIQAAGRDIDCENYQPPNNDSDFIMWYWYSYFYDDTNTTPDNLDNYTDPNGANGSKHSLPKLFVRHVSLDILEIVIGIFFTVDFLLRIITCPSIKRYFMSIVNLSDIVALFGFYTYLIIVNVEKEHRYTDGWVRIIDYLQVFRVLRLCRVVKNVRASRVLVFSICKNVHDAALLGMLLLVCVSMSSCLIYFVEDRSSIKSIPQAWYWSIITITTVGYGDLSPKTTAGQVLASILAICGVMLLAITLPMFVNNFICLYNYSCLDEKIDADFGNVQSNRRHKNTLTNVSTIKRPVNYDNIENDHVSATSPKVSLRDIHIPGEVMDAEEGLETMQEL